MHNTDNPKYLLQKSETLSERKSPEINVYRCEAIVNKVDAGF